MYRRIASNFLVFSLRKWRFQKYAVQIARNFHRYNNSFTRRPQHLFLAMASVGFSFHRFGITDEELNSSLSENTSYSDTNEKWERIYKDANIQVFRRVVPELGGIYEYRCVGTYDDISANSFVQAQMDDKYRCQWDENIIILETIEEDEATDSQVVQWLAKYPYPLNPRLYIFVRRKIYDERNQRITVVSKALTSLKYPDDGKNIRVTNYASKLVVKARTSLEEPGLDYVLIYHDDPKTSIPSIAQTWIMKYGGPEFLKKIYSAAKVLEARWIAEKEVRNKESIAINEEQTSSEEDDQKSDS
ncbi:START domain-containing protein [Ditylenchus destructor]|uniref:Phosphatidylcholine transfer protein n=1 Tax=Ditylenchus destructor TaxID=166010 RepID=A0AAD4NCB0_9BILA|nr:START domain-containing protein [Ditylenchus destructor]